MQQIFAEKEIGEDMSYGSALDTTKLLQCHVLEFYLSYSFKDNSY